VHQKCVGAKVSVCAQMCVCVGAKVSVCAQMRVCADVYAVHRCACVRAGACV
jgi:hypothetical protein